MKSKSPLDSTLPAVPAEQAQVQTQPAPSVPPEVASTGQAVSEAPPSTIDPFLREAARISNTHSIPPGHVVAHRYRLDQILGRGAHGSVWDAEDLVTGERVALKRLTHGFSAAAARARREIASLRLLRLSGVVRLLDEGMDNDCPFLVMERVPGVPFPGVPPKAAWSDIAPAAVGLLETLARVHAVGIIHRDLKPANILVDTDGRPTLLDFGLARPDTPLEDGITLTGQILGTPAFLAPEQILGKPVSAYTDLYAVGVMLYHALSGMFPHPIEKLRRLFVARTTQRPAPLGQIASSVPAPVPAPVAALVDMLLEIDPAKRPGSAIEALDRLRGETPRDGLVLRRIASLSPARAPAEDLPLLDERALRELFAGPDRLFHIPEDAARELFRRTNGSPERVTEEVTAWVRAGIARWNGDHLVVNRDIIDRLETGLLVTPTTSPGGEPAPLPRLFHLLAASDEDLEQSRAITAESCDLAQRLASEGHLGQAATVVRVGLRAARRLGMAPVEELVPLLSLAVEIAIADRMPSALDRALYEIVRIEPQNELLEQLADLVRTALAVGQRTERALEQANTLPAFDDPVLERQRQGLRVLAARGCSMEQEEAVLAEVARWVEASGDPAARAALAGWMGRLCYRQGRFEEAAALHLEAAAGERWATAKLGALLSCASARMEAFQFEEAATSAHSALALARAYRLPFFEARAEWILRSVAYRMNAVDAPDLELCDAVAKLGMGDLEAMICMNEAAVAFRAGDRSLTRDLARRARRAWMSVGERSGGTLLARSLELEGGPSQPDDEVRTLVDRALACRVPGVGIQALGLIALTGRAPPLDRAAVDTLSTQVPARFWDLRLDVLSVREALELTVRLCRSP